MNINDESDLLMFTMFTVQHCMFTVGRAAEVVRYKYDATCASTAGELGERRERRDGRTGNQKHSPKRKAGEA